MNHHYSDAGRRNGRIAAAFGFAAIVLTTTATGAYAAAPATRVAEDPVGRLVLVLDSSGSMKEPARGGQTKIAAAKHALHRVIDGLPDDADVGLRVYGATVFSRSDAGACQDSQLVVPLGTDNRDDLSRAVDDYRPFGETPIGYALREAGRDVGTEGRRSIILVSDGEDTCAPPSPCQVARELASQDIDLTIDVVGLDVTGRARDQLRCVARVGRGTYYDADDADSLSNAMEQTSTRAFRPLSLSGDPILGTRTPANAPEAASGLYLDTFPQTGRSKHYALTRSRPGTTFHVGAASLTGQWLTAINLEIRTVDGDTCNSYYGGDLSSGFAGAAVTTWAQPTIFPGCEEDERLVLEVWHGTTLSVPPDTPMQLVIIEEPPVTTTRGLPGEEDDPTWQRFLQSSVGEKVTPGSGFDNAPAIADGRYESSILPGELQFFRVPLDWGQQLQAQVRWHDLSLPAPTILAGQIAIIGPTRGDATSVFSDTSVEPPPAIEFVDNGNVMGAMTQPVRYLNRQTESADAQATAIPGDYYVVVSVDAQAGPVGRLLPYTLDVRTGGTPGDGAPQYVGDSELTTPTPETDGEGDAESESDGTETAADGGSSGDDATLRNVAYGLAGVGGVLLLLAGGLLLLARSRP